jgi:class 3 adenylate cyclase
MSSDKRNVYKSGTLYQNMTPKAVELNSQILTVMFLDIVSYTKTTSELSRSELDELHERFDSLALPVFDLFQGRVIKKIGDAYLVTFTSPTNAVHCGIELQRKFHSYFVDHPQERKLAIRVAMDIGEVVVRNGDVYGDAVNTAARIESIGGAHQVLFSEKVYRAMNTNEIAVVFIGRHPFKGLKKPLGVFRVKTKADITAEIKKRRAQRVTRIKNAIIYWITLFFALVFMFVVGVVLYKVGQYLLAHPEFFY